MRDSTTKAERRHALEQAIASTRLEGHVPSEEFLEDCQAVVDGTMTLDQMRAASKARALAADRAAATGTPLADAA
jgi:hypothetical protein